MRIVDRLLGRRKRTSETIQSEIIAQEVALLDAQSRTSVAIAGRDAAIEEGDKGALMAAEAAHRDARADIEICEHAICKLREALVQAQDSEGREALRVSAEALRVRKADLQHRIRTEYPEAAQVIGRLMTDLVEAERLDATLLARARELGESVDLGRHPEAFRSSEGRWSGSWPSPSGSGVVQGPVGDAPRGTFVWVDDAPVPTIPEAQAFWRQGASPECLVTKVRLPAVLSGEAAFYEPQAR